MSEDAVESGNGEATSTRPIGAPRIHERRAAIPKLGEELPVFCERCGYSLHGLPQCRCEACTLLQFVCPECNHRQPINTLRPAAQRLIGRIRATFLVAVVFFKVNWFGWLLFAWFAMGVEWSYRYNFQQVAISGGSGMTTSITHVPRSLDYEVMLAFGCFALPFGLISRLLLLRWRSGFRVGVLLGVIVAVVALLGGWFRGTFNYMNGAAPLGRDFYFLLLIGGACTLAGACIAWPVWLALVRAFLPKRSAAALLDWQRSLSDMTPDPNATQRLDVPV